MGAISTRSEELYRRAARVLLGGTSRDTTYMAPHPIYAASGEGCRIRDVDGNERLDFHNNFTTLIHGHAHPHVRDAVERQLRCGSCFALATEAEVELAELLTARVPAFERIRFTNSGTEAVMMALKAARAFTGRAMIARCEGSYHGSSDFAEVSTDPTPETWGPGDPLPVPRARGTPPSALGEVVVIPFNDPVAAERILAPHAEKLAAVLVDPLPNRAGLVPAAPEFLPALRQLSERHGIVLVYDEVMSFRLGYQGAQGAFGVTPDLTVLGKVIGGGFPVGAVAGRGEIMSVFDPSPGRPAVPHGGTFTANPITMVAGRATLELLTPEALDRLNALGELARTVLRRAFDDAGVPGQVTGAGSLLRLHLTARPIVDYRSAYPTADEQLQRDGLHRYLLDHGILMAGNGLAALSTPMGEDEVRRLVDAVGSGLRVVAS